MEEKKFCKFCGEKIDKSSIVCPKCGRQLELVKKTDEKGTSEQENKTEKEVKFYETQWFMWLMLIVFAPVGIFFMWKFNHAFKPKTKIILTIIFAIVFLIAMASDESENKTTKLEWESIELNQYLPAPEKLLGEIISNRSDLVIFDIKNIEKAEYKAYIDKCRIAGYNIDLEYEPWDTVYGAFNNEGYSLRIIYSESLKEMNITLETPKKDKMEKIEWPTSGLAAKLPKIKSTLGNISYNNSESFIVDIGDMTIEDYKKYVKECGIKGFTKNYNQTDKTYTAENKEGYKLSIMYLGANVVEISLKAPKKDEENITSANSNEIEENKSETTNKDNGLSNDFKKSMDDYEEFMNQYVTFMKKYKKSNGTDTSLLKDYTKYMSKYGEMVSSFAKWKEKDLNKEEAKYYLDVQTRINKKLIEVTI